MTESAKLDEVKKISKVAGWVLIAFIGFWLLYSLFDWEVGLYMAMSPYLLTDNLVGRYLVSPALEKRVERLNGVGRVDWVGRDNQDKFLAHLTFDSGQKIVFYDIDDLSFLKPMGTRTFIVSSGMSEATFVCFGPERKLRPGEKTITLTGKKNSYQEVIDNWDSVMNLR